MLLSAKTQNACLAMIELASRHVNPKPVCLKTIADAQKISSQFLVQILLQLKRAGLVQSTRGASGGYRLAKHPNEITLLDVVQAMNGVAEVSTPDEKAPAAALVLHEAWHEVVDQHFHRLAMISLSDLAQRASLSAEAEGMYHI